MTDLPVTIRAFRDTDKPFILDSWVNSIVYSTPSLFWCPKSVLKSNYRRIVDKLIDARPELFRVLVNEDDEDQIFGWSCTDDDATHFVYVKEEFRRLRLGWSLWGSDVVSNWTKVCESIQKRRDMEYKPSLFKELINGINQTMVSYTPSKHNVSKQDIQISNTEG